MSYAPTPEDLREREIQLQAQRRDPPYAHHPGSLDHRQHPSRFGNTLRYLDGRVEQIK